MRLKLVPSETNWDFFRLSSVALVTSGVAVVASMIPRAPLRKRRVTAAVSSASIATKAVLAMPCTVSTSPIIHSSRST